MECRRRRPGTLRSRPSAGQFGRAGNQPTRTVYPRVLIPRAESEIHLMTRTCVVTGAAGFIGSRLSHRLLDDGWFVRGVDGFTDSYDPAEKMARAARLVGRPGFSLVTGHLLDLPLTETTRAAEVVFHLAARAGVRSSFALEGRYRRDNVASTERLLDACQATGVRRVVYASSSSVYGEATPPFSETAPTAPVSPYGRTKLEAERAVLAVPDRDLETVALRYFTVYGPGQRPDMGLRLFAEAALTGQPVRLLGDGTQSRDFTFIDDIVNATVLAADAPVDHMAVNVGGGSRVTLLEVFDLLEQLVGRRVDVRAEGFAAGDVHHTGADLHRAATLLGYRARTSFADGMAMEVDWLRTRTTLEARWSA